MANTLTPVIVRMLAKAMAVLRARTVMPGLVSREYEEQTAMSFGKSIDVPIYADQIVGDVAPGPTPITPGNSVATKISIELNKHRHASFFLTDAEMDAIDPNSKFINSKMISCINPLAKDINSHILANYKKVYNYVGLAGTTPFASKVDVINDAGALLNDGDTGQSPRHGVLNFAAGGSFRTLSGLGDVNKTGKDDIKIKGIIGERYGFDWFEDGQVPYHTAGTIASSMSVTGVEPIGETTINLTNGAGTSTFNEGDIVTFAGDIQTYVVTAGVTIGSSTTGDIVINPGLKVATAGSDAVTLKASHRVNLLFHPGAFAFAMRPLSGASAMAIQLGATISSITDPVSGLTIRLELSRQNKQFAWDFDVLYGSGIARPEFASRLAG